MLVIPEHIEDRKKVAKVYFWPSRILISEALRSLFQHQSKSTNDKLVDGRLSDIDDICVVFYENTN